MRDIYPVEMVLADKVCRIFNVKGTFMLTHPYSILQYGVECDFSVEILGVGVVRVTGFSSITGVIEWRRAWARERLMPDSKIRKDAKEIMKLDLAGAVKAVSYDGNAREYTPGGWKWGMTGRRLINE